ncbi:MAG: FumA C-terminus/TtdB family hydratase beta subunit [Planctomycetota bacterium]|nr:FumA C-terminus/TtdB family hydratase beta subunit [Planctomycetota bacterium]
MAGKRADTADDTIRLRVPFGEEVARSLRAGQHVTLSGTAYAARDAAHKRIVEAVARRERLPVDFRDQLIYYVGPTPARPGEPIGSAGPTTSTRMDDYMEAMLELGIRATMGKGIRSRKVMELQKRYGAVYFQAIGGAGALLARHIKAAEVVAYEDLGAEALRRLELEGFPAIVAVDAHGGDAFAEGQRRYCRL